ncbi:hypothetical protein CLF_109250 [Clonorchis sinensis]|uniref:Uncharacterized protein n=1 Tax=Clonorchis sinensis TaxID=79923 RepID=G7YJ43_CLOSI|nr:hypothetical protein CLF_109250 [Clonorchis sinensis]
MENKFPVASVLTLNGSRTKFGGVFYDSQRTLYMVHGRFISATVYRVLDGIVGKDRTRTIKTHDCIVLHRRWMALQVSRILLENDLIACMQKAGNSPNFALLRCSSPVVSPTPVTCLWLQKDPLTGVRPPCRCWMQQKTVGTYIRLEMIAVFLRHLQGIDNMFGLELHDEPTMATPNYLIHHIIPVQQDIPQTDEVSNDNKSVPDNIPEISAPPTFEKSHQKQIQLPTTESESQVYVLRLNRRTRGELERLCKALTDANTKNTATWMKVDKELSSLNEYLALSNPGPLAVNKVIQLSDAAIMTATASLVDRRSAWTQHIGTSTKYSAGQQTSLLNLVLTNKTRFVDQVINKAPLGHSDHCVLTFDSICYWVRCKTRIRNFWRADISGMRIFLAQVKLRSATFEDLYRTIVQKVHEADAMFVPKKTSTQSDEPQVTQKDPASSGKEKSAQKAIAVLRMIRRTLTRITRTDFQILYGAYIRPLLEYANPVVCSGRTKDLSSLSASSELLRKWLTASNERQPLKDKNKPDPGNLGESLDPVYQSVNP